MVHALAEASRVVSLGGVILDLRPLAMDAALEVTSPDTVHRLGNLSGASGLAADFACRRAVEEALARGSLVEDAVRYLRFAFYWDSLPELRTFWATPKSRRQAPSEALLADAGSRLEGLGGPARIRVQEILRLARYRMGLRPKVD